MDLDVVKEFIQLAKQEGVSELKYEKKDFKISVNFESKESVNYLSYPSLNNQPLSKPNSSEVSEDQKDIHVITSPFVGTYYTQPAPGKAPVVKKGDKISTGQTLCILEAMKIMNEIEAEISGEVVEICVDNENLVEYGQPLFKIKV